jgi:hypothetical protein
MEKHTRAYVNLKFALLKRFKGKGGMGRIEGRCHVAVNSPGGSQNFDKPHSS